MELEKILREYNNFEKPVEISPELAQQILDSWPTGCRPPCEDKVIEYCELMKSGVWGLKEEAPIIICLTDEGDWDGRHRLLAFIKSKLLKFKTYITIHIK